KGPPDAQRRQCGGFGESDFIVLLVGRAGPETNCIDGSSVRPILALGGEFGLMRVDPGQVVGTVDAGDMIERIGLRDRSANEAAMEDVGAADRGAVALGGRIRLASVDWPC